MEYKALICITTCNRLNEVKKYILPYIEFSNKEEPFSFLLSLDGKNKEYIDFCNEYKIPLLYSDEREGVGLSKNRVLKQFPNFDYYFFVEDDIELVNEKIFSLFINIFINTNYHHFSLSHRLNAIRVEKVGSVQLTHNNYGGGQFNFYTKDGLNKVGGWNPYFAKYRRFGHTEHTYRFYHAGLTPSPFIFIDEARNMFINHDPPHVTNLEMVLENPTSELIPEEEELLRQKTTYCLLTTLSPMHFNGFDMKYNSDINDFLGSNKQKYAFVKDSERRKCFSEFYFFKFNEERNIFYKTYFFASSFVLWPLNRHLKHFVKKKLGLV